jgi:hypothetical protein
MRKLLIAALLMQGGSLLAQLPEDALRYGYPLMGGTARNQAIGGTGGSLGGDLTAAYINPAGIGLYKNKELVLSPSFSLLNNKFDYRNAQTTSSNNVVTYGTSGFVFGKLNKYDSEKSSAFSISINQLASYNTHVEYKGFNNQSSWSEKYLEEAQRGLSGSPSEIVKGLESRFPFGTSLAFWSFLIDTATDADGFKIQSLAPIPGNTGTSTDGVNQHNIVDTKGGAHEIALAFANSIQNRLNLGVSVGIPIYSYTKNQTYREEDASTNTNNDFAYFEYKEHYRTTGIGLNVKLGLIYRPIERLRLGFAIHTPTFASFTDRINSSITTDTENYTTYQQPITYTSDEIRGDNLNAGRYQYGLRTPMKFLVSGSWVLNEVSDVKQQKGFLTADLEYVPYGTTHYSAVDQSTDEDIVYYEQLNKQIKDRYKGAINLRLGGEVKFNTFMARAGFAYLGTPYRDKQLQGSRMLLSGGVGYRNRGFFVDLTYVHAMIKDSQIPYYLLDKPNVIADGKNSRGNIIFTFGVKI